MTILSKLSKSEQPAALPAMTYIYIYNPYVRKHVRWAHAQVVLREQTAHTTKTTYEDLEEDDEVGNNVREDDETRGHRLRLAAQTLQAQRLDDYTMKGKKANVAQDRS